MTRRRMALGLTLCTLLACAPGAHADLLEIIGTANYDGGQYNLIYEAAQGLVWLDYSKDEAPWQNQKNWAAGLGSSLTVEIDPLYTTTIDNWTTGWRLPSAGDNPQTEGNVTTSEMGHLYQSLGLTVVSGGGQPNTDSDFSPFVNIVAYGHWSGTESNELYQQPPDYLQPVPAAWMFGLSYGIQGFRPRSEALRALAVHEGTVSVVPVPGATLLGVLGLSSAGAWLKRRRTR